MASVVGLATHPRSFPPVDRLMRVIERIVPWSSPPHIPSDEVSAVIVGEVLPRLVLAHSNDAMVKRPASEGVSERDVSAFTALTLSLEADGLCAEVEAMVARGVAVDLILVDLLAPVARRLGEMWERDDCDFVDVTMALWRLQEVVRALGAHTTCSKLDAGRRRAIFAALPGDQHSFGTVIVEEMFRREGWQSELIVEGDISDLLAAVGGNWIDVIGLTVSCDAHSDKTASVIQAVRSVSRNPRIAVLVGGPVFAGNPKLAIALGADGTAPDARAAVAMAEELVTSLQQGAAAFA